MRIKWRIEYNEGRKQPYTLWSNRAAKQDGWRGRKWYVEKFFEDERELYDYRRRVEDRVSASA